MRQQHSTASAKEEGKKEKKNECPLLYLFSPPLSLSLVSLNGIYHWEDGEGGGEEEEEERQEFAAAAAAAAVVDVVDVVLFSDDGTSLLDVTKCAKSWCD